MQSLYQRVIYTLCLLYILPTIHAQTQGEHDLSLAVGIMSHYAYDCRTTYYFKPNDYVGLGGSIGYYRQFTDVNPTPTNYNHASSTLWQLAEESERAQNFYIIPSLLVRTPQLMQLGKWRARASTELGVLVQFPLFVYMLEHTGYTSPTLHPRVKASMKGQWLAPEARLSLDFERRNTYLSIGYGISSLDIYSYHRNIVVDGQRFADYYPKKRINHTIFIKIGGWF